MFKGRMAFFAAALAGATMAASPSLAADPTYWDQPAPTFDWSGFYAGIQGGGGWGRGRVTDGVDTVVQHPSGGFLGGYVSGLFQYDWAVLGAEAELNYGWMRRTENFGPAPGTDIGQRINWFGSLNAVIGVPVDRALIYGTGGLAFGSVGHSQVMAPDSFSETRSTAGWTLGAGVDFAVTDDIIVGARYRYYDFGRVSYAPGGGFVPRDQRVSLHTIGARVGMKF